MEDRNAYMILSQMERINKEIKSQRQDKTLTTLAIIVSIVAIIINMAEERMSSCVKDVLMCIFVGVELLLIALLIARSIVCEKEKKIKVYM